MRTESMRARQACTQHDLDPPLLAGATSPRVELSLNGWRPMRVTHECVA